MPLNSLSNLLGSIGLDNISQEYNGAIPEIIFHSRFWPIPIHTNGGVYGNHLHVPFPVRPIPDINYLTKEVHSNDSNWNMHKEHEKAFWRIFDWNGKQIPFDNNWKDHPCYLVVPKTPESKISHSVHNSSPEEENVQSEESKLLYLFYFVISNLSLEVIEESIKRELPSPEEKASNNKSKNRNILRLKTKTGEDEHSKPDSKRRRKDKKAHKNQLKGISIDDNYNLITHFNALSVELWKEEIVQNKNTSKPTIKAEETKEEVKGKPLTWNCKKSRCLKFYCDWLAEGRMWTPECNWWDWANNEHHIEERKQFLDKNNDYFNGDVIEEVIVDGKKIIRHNKGCGCSNSGCKKKYWEWYKYGLNCSEKCKWKTCYNHKVILNN